MATVGFTSVYDTEDYWGTGAIAVKVTMPEDGDITSISFYMRALGSAGVKAAVFSHNSGSNCPASSLGVKARSFGTTGWGWQEFTFDSSISCSASDVVWLVAATESSLIEWVRDGTSKQTSVMDSITYSSWPSGAWSEYDKYAGPFSIYATYSTTPSGISIPLLNHLLLGD